MNEQEDNPELDGLMACDDPTQQLDDLLSEEWEEWLECLEDAHIPA